MQRLQLSKVWGNWRAWSNYVDGLTSVLSRRLEHYVRGHEPIIQGNACLVVLLHGLNGSPSDLQVQSDLFRAIGCTIYQPKISNHNKPLVEMAAPIVNHIQQHVAFVGPDPPVAIVGLSNGGRVGACVEIMLRRMIPNPVMLATMGTPFEGTVMMNMFGETLVKMGWYSRRIVDDLKINSQATQQLLRALRESHSTPKREYVFYSADCDAMVLPLESATPRIGKNETIVVVPNHCHTSIAEHTAQNQVERFIRFCRGNPHVLLTQQ